MHLLTIDLKYKESFAKIILYTGLAVTIKPDVQRGAFLFLNNNQLKIRNNYEMVL